MSEILTGTNGVPENGQVMRRRKRATRVCTQCKKRKIRCDRQLPCSNCVKSRGKLECHYDEESGAASASSNILLSSKTRALPYEQSAKQPLQFLNFNSHNMTTKSDTSEGASDSIKTNGKRERSNDNLRDSSSSRSSSSSSRSANGKKKMKSADNVSISLNELRKLKERLATIESNLGSAKTKMSEPQRTTPLQYSISSPKLSIPMMNNQNWPSNVPSSIQSFGSHSGLSPQPQFSTTHKLSNTRHQSPNIQLPPINVKDGISPYESSDYNGSSVGSIPSNNPPLSNLARLPTNLIGVNPYLNETETINFYENYSSVFCKDTRRISYGPFAWSSLMKRDQVLSTLWEYIGKQKESSKDFVFCSGSNEITHEKTQLVTSEPKESEMHFRKKMLETGGYSDVVPYDLLKEKMKKNLKKETIPLGLTLYEGPLSCELQLVDKIKQILPKKKVIWKLVDRFFTWCYPFLPFLDEVDFVEWVEKIVGPKSFDDVNIEEVKIERRLDLAVIGILLIVMRLAYLSLFSNKLSVNEERLNSTDPSEEVQDTKYMMRNPISINTIAIANACLYQFDILRRTSMPVLQLAIFIKFYHTFAPEDGDDGDGADSNALTAMMIQMAYSLGLYREPNNYPGILNNKKLNHLGRKIWHLLVMIDIHNAYSFGSPLLIDSNSYDTKVPFHEDGNENLKDKELDRYITERYFPSNTELNEMVKSILIKTLNVSGRVKLCELCNLLSEFEVKMAQKYTSLKDCLTIRESESHIFSRNFSSKFFISLKSFLVSIYFHIFLHYEHKDVQLSFFYLKKILKIAATEIMPHYFELLGNSEVICDSFINPKLQQIIHKSNQIFIAMIIRVNLSIYFLKSQSDHESKCFSDTSYYNYYKELCKFSSCLTRCAEVSIAAVSKLSTRYFYAWKLTKSHTYLLKLVTTLDFYKDPLHIARPNLRLPEFSTNQISDLVEMCESALRILGKVGLQGNEFCSDVSYKQFKHQNSEVSTISSTKQSDNSTTDLVDLSTPASNVSLDGKAYTNEFGLDLVNNAEIDSIWLQMLSTQQQQQQQQFIPQSPGGQSVPYLSPLTGQLSSEQANINNSKPSPSPFPGQSNQSAMQPISTPGQIYETPFTLGFPRPPSSGFGVDENGSVDLFAELPLNQMFNL
ncbi:MRR1 [Candida oxycetoniae]|uniref:MRR1 n=1 Tax=Candida oxycetoniae TaxID=497107 RepID=A0AAI9WZB4_9ASCO|nr:MRR1 [Candida oxycetoniae]KAI3406236.2 MRR1 [Candida oxycetoniae]